MRNIIIIILVGAVIWLLIERDRLTKEVAAAQTQVSEAQAEVAIVKNPRGAGQANRSGSWLDTHIERGANVLKTQQTEKGLRP